MNFVHCRFVFLFFWVQGLLTTSWIRQTLAQAQPHDTGNNCNSDGGAPTTAELTIEQAQQAVFDNTTEQFRVQLRCGHFLSHDNRTPDTLLWKTPSGAEVSTPYDDNGYFYLTLPNPVKGGNYTCRLPPKSPFTLCLPTDSPLLREATVQVDVMAARLSLLEAKEEALTNVNRQLKTELKQTQEELKGIESELSQANTKLSNSLQDLQMSLNQFHIDHRAKRASFHAMLNKSINDFIIGEPVVFNVAKYNQGGGYNQSSGKFTAPIRGSYFFIFSLSPVKDGDYCNSVLRVEGVDSSIVHLYDKYDSGYFRMATAHTVVHLDRGQKAWVEAYGPDESYYNYLSFFSGFLVHAD